MEEDSTTDISVEHKKLKNPRFLLLSYSGEIRGHQKRRNAGNSQEIQRANWIEPGFSFGPRRLAGPTQLWRAKHNLHDT
jgi:hypothetical protein